MIVAHKVKIPTGRRQTSWLFTSMMEELNTRNYWEQIWLAVRATIEPHGASGLQSPQLLGHANLNKNALCHFLYRCAESFYITGNWGNDICSLWRTAINCFAHHSPTGTVYKRYMHEPLIFSKQTLPIQRQIVIHVQLLITLGL